jgi:IS5 family transposase
MSTDPSENCKFIGFLDGNLNYRGMHFGRQQFARVAFPEQLLFDTFLGTTN